MKPNGKRRASAWDTVREGIRTVCDGVWLHTEDGHSIGASPVDIFAVRDERRYAFTIQLTSRSTEDIPELQRLCGLHKGGFCE